MANIFFYLTIIALLVAAIFDLRQREVDWRILVFGVSTAIIYALLEGNYPSAVSSLLVVVSIPLFLALVSKEKWMGWGDVLFAVQIALITGYPKSLIALCLAFWSGSIFGIIYLVLKPGNKNIPFGPFLVFGCILAIIFGQSIITVLLSSSVV